AAGLVPSRHASGHAEGERAVAGQVRRTWITRAQRWHELGPPPLGARDSREMATAGATEETPMAIVAGFDVHRAQITFDALDDATGEVRRGRIASTPEAVREWVGRFAGEEIHVAVEAGTGWLFVCEALREA